MKKMLFCCEYQYNKKSSWSGSHHAVFSGLSKNFEMIEFDYGVRKAYTFFNKLFLNKLLHKDSSVQIERHYFKKIEEIIKNNYIKNIFQFTLYPNIDYVHSYIYVDLLFCYLKYIYDNDRNSFEYSTFDIDNVNKRLEEEEKILKKDNITILTMSKNLYNFLVNEYHLNEEKVFFVGGGINLEYTEIDFSKKNGMRFLFSGKDFKRKNGNLVIEAFKKVKEKYPNIELYIISGESQNNNKDGIFNLGKLSFEESTKYFKLCDFFVMPSIFEAYGFVFPEALSYGLPCIGRNAFEMPYFIKNGETGFLLNNQDSDELASLMIKLIENKQISFNVQNNRKEIYEQYSWKTSINRMVDVINKTGGIK